MHNPAVLCDPLQQWPEAAVTFAIHQHRRILSDGKAFGVEATEMALRRTRVWWQASTLDAEPKPKSKRRKSPDIETALDTLRRCGARLERSESGIRLAVACREIDAALQDALTALGISHLERRLTSNDNHINKGNA